ncbi:hypothetical protein [Terasakiella sp.]|uniref:PDC sensor domain-containing protein n=1 Tax=Terasakiella sp. TaxID=2034861 RepID=UPI003AA7D67D
MVRFFLLTFAFLFSAVHAHAGMDRELKLSALYQAVHAQGLLRSADITLVGITSLFSHKETSAINDLIIHNSLNRHVDRVPGLSALFTTDVNGNLKHDSFRYPTRSLNLKDRAYINNALRLTNNELYIGKPIKNAIVAYDSLPLSRPIFNDQGYITGVGVAVMTPDHLLQRTKICKKCVVSIFKTNGTKIVSFPAAVEAQPDIQKFMADHPDNTIVDLTINKLPTLTVWTQIADYDLVLLYSYFK